MWPDSPPPNPTSLVDLQLAAWRWGIEVSHWTYNASSPTRCTGTDNEVDCSGAECVTVNSALTQAHLPLIAIPQNSSSFARWCHYTPRPQWMNEHFGNGQGFSLTPAQANVLPAAWAFHGPNEGLDGDGPAGHIKSKWYLNDGIHWSGSSVEAMGVHAGVGFSTFLDSHCTYFAWPPMFPNPFPQQQPLPVEYDMLTFVCPNKPVHDGLVPRADFYPQGANPFLPNGGIVLHYGASLDGDLGRKSPTDPHSRLRVPKAGIQWTSATAVAHGLLIVKSDGGAGEIRWS